MTADAGTDLSPANPITQSPASTSSERNGLRWGVAAYLVWGLTTVFWKQLSAFNAFELIGYRIISSAILMAIFATVTGRMRPLLRRIGDRRLLAQVALAAVLLTVNWTTYVWAVSHDDVLATALGYFITPIGLMLAGALVLREHLRNVQRAALALAVVAVAILTIGYGHVPWVSLIIAVTWVSYTFVKKRSTLAPIESLTAETLLLLVPAIVTVVLASSHAGSAVHTATAGDWVLIAMTGVVTTVPLLMFAVAAQRLALSVMALIQYIVPTINFLLGWLVYDEPLNGARVAGFVLVWIGLAAVTLDSLRRARIVTASPA